jgi:hypothetical protein
VDIEIHWLRYKHDYAAFPTTTHFVERSVKLSNLCSSYGRSEERTSQFAICFNVVHDVNDITKKRMIGGKSKKGKKFKNEDKIQARGKIRNSTAIENVLLRHQLIETAVQDVEMKNIYASIAELCQFSTKSSFRAERQKNEHGQNVKKVLASRRKNNIRKPNKIERETGFDITATMKNEVRFHDATKEKYEAGIVAELNAREDQLASTDTFTMKKNLLKKLVAEEKHIKNVSDVKSFPIRSTFDWSPITTL